MIFKNLYFQDLYNVSSSPCFFRLPVFANSTCMWLKIPGITESSHMRKERKTQCYLTLINVKKTVTCSFCLFFSRLSCELLHYNCSFQRIKKVRFEIHLKGSAQWCELPNRKKKKKGEPVLCAETDPEYRVLQVFGAHAWPPGTLTNALPTPATGLRMNRSPERLSFRKIFHSGCPGPSQECRAFLNIFNVSGESWDPPGLAVPLGWNFSNLDKGLSVSILQGTL